jgi:O-acetyl-ADP-ribose deacetylase (regulator of RNase III)
VATDKIKLGVENITRAEVDAIVNAANSRLSHGGGVARAIADAAGPELMAESATAPFCPAGQAVATTGGKLPAKYVIHAVGPIWRGGDDNEAALLASAYRSSLRVAAVIGASSVAFPSISTGIYGYPIRLAAPIALSALSQEWEEQPSIEEVRFCLYSAGDLAVYTRAQQKLESEN